MARLLAVRSPASSPILELALVVTPRVLVSGATGFVGRHVQAHLRGIGWDVVPWSSGLDPGSAPIDYFVDLAARTDIRWSLEHPDACLHQNLRTTVRFLEWARVRRPRAYVHLSTVEQRDVRNPYAAGKAAQEAACWAYRASYGVPVTVLEADILVGGGQPATKVVPSMIQAIRDGYPVPIWERDGVPGWRYYASVSSATDAIRFLLEAEPVPDVDRPRFLMPGHRLTNYELAVIVARFLGRGPSEWVAGYSEMPDHIRLGSEPDGRLLTALGWSEPVTFLDEVRRLLSHWSAWSSPRAGGVRDFDRVDYSSDWWREKVGGTPW